MKKQVNCDDKCILCRNNKESIYHLFVECDYARSCWNQLRIQLPTGNVDSLHTWISSLAENVSIHQTLRNNAVEEKWSKPKCDFLKLNVDAVAIEKQRGCMGLGCVLRNDRGQFVAARGVQWKGVYSSKEAEAVAIKVSQLIQIL
ncbi:PREDICTED: uncharacterized protein LOC109158087 [Ipomoea nil]|uniref:uncharacterized protein LOC109158087 n=1 Tax=Ipomoea nil TaxID=35883 RepID=UPI0009018376|nr:PREDICTED: uncharacterized protein LOC109158087 [Ipomoea nil]